MQTLIIDSHCHAGKGDGLTGPWDTNASLDEFMEWSEEAGISKTVLFAAFNSNYSSANEKVSRIVKNFSDKFYGYAFVNAERDKGNIFYMVNKAVQEYNFCGIKCHHYDAPISREICDTARKLSLPVLYDVMAEIPGVELIAQEYPDVAFIIPHLGSFADDWKAQQSFIDKLVKHKNVYTDTSGVRRFDLLKEAYERAGAHKILFGSDGPWLHPAVELAKVYALKCNAHEEQQILSGNFLRLQQARKPRH
ncbi:MAG TPA: amidohydrolase family protein [Bacteroidia bacterium]|nr:amidohydrolase family protein [Bacteroidia bacterium]